MNNFASNVASASCCPIISPRAFSAVNRSYYAVFHAIKAIEIFDNFDSKKHSGLISNFRQKDIKTGIFDIEYSEILKSLAQYRQDSDYDIFADISL